MSDMLNRYLMASDSYSDFLCHHGILGQKWGVRRFQNPDGTLTEAGKKRYYDTTGKSGKVLTKAGAKAVGKDLAKLSKLRNMSKAFDGDESSHDPNYYKNKYDEARKNFKTKWGEGQDGMIDWAGEHKGALDKMEKLDKKGEEIDKKVEFKSPLGKRYQENLKKEAAKDLAKSAKRLLDLEGKALDKDGNIINKEAYNKYIKELDKVGERHSGNAIFDAMYPGRRQENSITYGVGDRDTAAKELASIKASKYKDLNKQEQEYAKAKCADGFSDSERKLYVRDRSAFDKLFDAEVDTSKIKDSMPGRGEDRKEKEEGRLLDLWSDERVSTNSRDAYLCSALQKRMTETSGDWYNGKSVSRANKAASERLKMAESIWDEKYAKLKNPKDPNYRVYVDDLEHVTHQIDKYRDDLCGVVLRDMGYEDTQKHRRKVESLVFYH